MEPKWIDYRAWHHDKKVMMHVSEIDFRKERVKEGLKMKSSSQDLTKWSSCRGRLTTMIVMLT